jgi:hypothetical protein
MAGLAKISSAHALTYAEELGKRRGTLALLSEFRTYGADADTLKGSNPSTECSLSSPEIIVCQYIFIAIRHFLFA